MGEKFENEGLHCLIYGLLNDDSALTWMESLSDEREI